MCEPCPAGIRSGAAHSDRQAIMYLSEQRADSDVAEEIQHSNRVSEIESRVYFIGRSIEGRLDAATGNPQVQEIPREAWSQETDHPGAKSHAR